jgi:hypothetical protein
MNTLSIGNIKNGDKGVKCDRSTPLGNPFFMKRDGSNRDAVCDAFQDYHDLIVNEEMLPFTAAQRVKRKYRLDLAMAFKFPTNQEYLAALAEIQPGDKLICWCFPLRCHCQTHVNHKLAEWGKE